MWLTRLFFALDFFVIPIAAWIHGVMLKDDVAYDCHMTFWFLTVWIIENTHVVIGVYALITQAVGKTEEVPIDIQVPGSSRSSPTKNRSSARLSHRNGGIELSNSAANASDMPPHSPKKAWATI